MTASRLSGLLERRPSEQAELVRSGEISATERPAGLGELRRQAGVTDEAVRFSALVRIWNITGQPVPSLPLGAPGVQLVAAPGRDDLVLSLAAQLEGAALSTGRAERPSAGLRSCARRRCAGSPRQRAFYLFRAWASTARMRGRSRVLRGRYGGDEQDSLLDELADGVAAHVRRHRD